MGLRKANRLTTSGRMKAATGIAALAAVAMWLFCGADPASSSMNGEEEGEVFAPEKAATSRRTSVEAIESASFEERATERVEGMVTDVEDRPLAATVVLQPSHLATRVSRIESRADGDGRFSVEVPPGRRWLLSVSTEAHASKQLEDVRGGSNVGVIRLAPRRRIDGRVSDVQGRAIEGAVVAYTSGFTPVDEPIATCVAGEDGAFGPIAADGLIYLRASAAGFETAARVLPPTSPYFVEMVLRRLREDTVIVRRAGSGAPVAGALVSIRRYAPSSSHQWKPGRPLNFEIAKATTDDEGTCRVLTPSPERGPKIPHDRHLEHRGALVSKPGYSSRWVELGDRPAGEPFVVEMAPEAVIEGRVVDESGTPVAGRLVTAESQILPVRSSDTAGSTPFGSNANDEDEDDVARLATSVTDGGGRYRVGVPFVDARAPVTMRCDGGLKKVDCVPAEADVVVAPDLVVESATCLISGVVRDELGATIGDVDVALSRRATAITGPDGRFELRFTRRERDATQNLDLRCRKPGFVDAAVPLFGGVESEVVDVVMERAVRFEGRVVDLADAPMPGVSLRVVPASVDPAAAPRRDAEGTEFVHVVSMGKSDVSGRFAIDIPRSGAHVLAVVGFRTPDEHVEVFPYVDTAGGELRMHVGASRPKVNAEIAVVDPNGEPVRTPVVLALRSERGVPGRDVACGPSGVAKLKGLPVGAYDVDVRALGRASVSTTLHFEREDGDRGPCRREVRLPSGADVAIRLRLVGGSISFGAAVVGARILGADGNVVANAVADREGVARFSGIPAGSYVASAGPFGGPHANVGVSREWRSSTGTPFEVADDGATVDVDVPIVSTISSVVEIELSALFDRSGSRVGRSETTAFRLACEVAITRENGAREPCETLDVVGRVARPVSTWRRGRVVAST